MNNFIQRTITGFFFVTILLSGIFFGKYTFIGLFMLITFTSLWEFYSMTEKSGFRPQKLIGTLAGTAFFLISSLYLQRVLPQAYLIFLFPMLFLIMILELFKPTDKPITNTAITLVGVFYLSMPLVLLNYLAYPPPIGSSSASGYNPNIILGFFFLMWTNDSFAYLTGVKFGKRKLFESISPKKTWEGSFGGAFFTIIAAFFLSHYFHELRLRDWLIMAGLITVFGTLGDLVQSNFKRSLNLKDSGTLLPGHGGILDRLDSVFIASPFVFAYIQYLK